MTAPLDPKRVVAEVLAGHLRGSYGDILQAMKADQLASGDVMKWKVSFGDLTVTEDDMTQGEAEDLEALCGVMWSSFDPHQSAKQATFVLAFKLALRDGIKRSDAIDVIRAAPMVDIIRTVEQYESRGPLVRTPASTPKPARSRSGGSRTTPAAND